MSACAFLSITRTEGPVALLVTLQVKQLCRDKKWEQHGLCLMKTIQGDSSFLSTKAPVMSWLYLAVSVLGISRFFREGSSGKNCKGNRYFSSLDSGDFRVLVLRLMFDSICMTGTNEWRPRYSSFTRFKYYRGKLRSPFCLLRLLQPLSLEPSKYILTSLSN